jgi:hypothetical protein
LYKLIPPSFAAPVPPLHDLGIVGLAFVQKHWPTEGKYVKKGIIVEDMDMCTGVSFAGWPWFTKKPVRY